MKTEVVREVCRIEENGGTLDDIMPLISGLRIKEDLKALQEAYPTFKGPTYLNRYRAVALSPCFSSNPRSTAFLSSLLAVALESSSK